MPYSEGNWYGIWGKRAFDLTSSVLGVMLLSPLFAVLALALRFTIGNPVLFKQLRPGYGGGLFTLLKFRTMTNRADKNGRILPDSQRLTSFGRFLRVSSLDELPELINVIKGDMSLVGPRPLLVRYSPYFTSEERARFLVKPGITGLSQVQGRNDLSWDMRMAKDVEYVQNYSFALDLKIIYLTVLQVIRRKGLRVDPGATMLNFDEERHLKNQKSNG